ncbi:MAG TPA: hypothetical protein VFF84_11600 [Sphingobium sp.]|nr:hypothetical protein [Sphingobium sp.]
MTGRRLAGFAGLSLIGFAATAALAQAPRMTAAEARLLYAAGGFPISADGKGPTNRCGKAASPRITFVDMNADGRREALFIDAGACYQPDGRWYAVATQNADGSWRRILEGPGTAAAVGTMANGWFVLTATSGGKTTRLHYNGTAYADARATPAPAAPTARAAAPVAATPPAAPPASAAPQGNAARDAAIFRAAGFRQVRGRWESGCYDPSSGAYYEPGAITDMRDLNGDGRPEAIITEGTTFCYGMTGQAFWLVSQQTDGSWKLITNEVGIPEFLKTKGVDGWPDISVGGPGFCFPVMRWNGRAYATHRLEYEGKPCKQ